MNRAFSAEGLTLHGSLGRCPRLLLKAAPLALNRCFCTSQTSLVSGKNGTCGSVQKHIPPTCHGAAIVADFASWKLALPSWNDQARAVYCAHRIFGCRVVRGGTRAWSEARASAF